MSRIFVVDDEDSILTLCDQIFTKEGHEVISFLSGEKALKMLESRRPDLVLMDLRMPGENGLEVLKRFPKEKGRRVPVALFSSYITQEIEKEAYAAGAIDVIPKDIETADLRERVRHLLRAKHRLFGEAEETAAKQKILVVDDEPGIRELLKDFFERQGYPTLTAKNGEEGVMLVRTEQPAMILLDVSMPGMDGIATLKKIREINPEVGVVMATSMRDEQTAREASELGAYAYVLKPFDMQYLELVVMTRLVIAA